MTRRSGPKTLTPDLGADAGGEHVDAVADGLCPDVGDAGDTQLVVEAREDRVLGGAFGPLVFRFEDDGGLGHVDRRRIG